jgi:MFS family permease
MSMVAMGLFALGCLRPATAGFLGLLALIGLGLGCFTPPNNASIMGSVPRQQSGLASGVLNMTRGMGTALGLALTGVLFDLTGGTSSDPHSVARAFSLTAIFLSAVAVVAVVLSGIGSRDPLHSTELVGVE